MVVDSRQAVKSGTFVDMLGFYEPKSGTRRIDGDKAKAWLAKGVQPSPTVHNMLVGEKILDKAKITVQKPKKDTPVPAPVAEAPKAEVAEETPAEEATEEATEEVVA